MIDNNYEIIFGWMGIRTEKKYQRPITTGNVIGNGPESCSFKSVKFT